MGVLSEGRSGGGLGSCLRRMGVTEGDVTLSKFRMYKNQAARLLRVTKGTGYVCGPVVVR